MDVFRREKETSNGPRVVQTDDPAWRRSTQMLSLYHGGGRHLSRAAREAVMYRCVSHSDFEFFEVSRDDHD